MLIRLSGSAQSLFKSGTSHITLLTLLDGFFQVINIWSASDFETGLFPV